MTCVINTISVLKSTFIKHVGSGPATYDDSMKWYTDKLVLCSAVVINETLVVFCPVRAFVYIPHQSMQVRRINDSALLFQQSSTIVSFKSVLF